MFHFVLPNTWLDLKPEERRLIFEGIRSMYVLSYKCLHSIIIQIYIVLLKWFFKNITRILTSSIENFFVVGGGSEVYMRNEGK